jgi:uncharacterized repeat protein (TIGR01451 family)
MQTLMMTSLRNSVLYFVCTVKRLVFLNSVLERKQKFLLCLWLVAPVAWAATITIPGTPMTIILFDTQGGRHQIIYNGVRQVYPNNSTSGDSGITLFFNGTSYGFSGNATGGTVGANVFTVTSQSALLGSGTAADPWRVDTFLSAGATVTIKQTVYYVNSDTFATFRWDVLSTTAYTGVKLLHGADILNNAQDNGYGAFNTACKSVSVGSPQTGTNFYQEFIPITSAAAYQETTYSALWTAMKAGSFNSTVNTTWHDAAMGLQWNFDLQAGVTKTILQKWNFGTSACSSSNTLPSYLRPELSISKTSSQLGPQVGDTLTYTITVTNSGTFAATGVSVTDTFPSSFLSFVSSTGCVSGGLLSGSTITCGLTDLAVGGSTSFTVRASVLDLGVAGDDDDLGRVIANSVSVLANEPENNTGNNSSSVNVTISKLKLAKEIRNVTSGGSFTTAVTGKPGEILEYRITYSRTGSAAFDIFLNDTVPANTTLEPDVYATTKEITLRCPNGTDVFLETGVTSTVAVDVAAQCVLNTALDAGATLHEALLNGETGYVLFRARIQ